MKFRNIYQIIPTQTVKFNTIIIRILIVAAVSTTTAIPSK